MPSRDVEAFGEWLAAELADVQAPRRRKRGQVSAAATRERVRREALRAELAAELSRPLVERPPGRG